MRQLHLPPGGISPAYAGDEAFARLLAALGSPMPLHQVKTLILGTIAATHMPRLSDLLAAVFGGEPPVFDSRDQLNQFFGHLMGLYNDLAAHQDKGTYRLKAIAPEATTDDIARYARTRREELTGFYRGLDLGGTDPDAMTERSRNALLGLAEVEDFYANYERLAREQSDADERTLRESISALERLDAVVEDHLATIQAEQKRMRAKLLRSADDQWPAGDPGQADRVKVGRNEPCPCGSGRKFKHCCGRN